MEAITEFLEGPAKVWHILLLAITLAATLHQIQKQLSAIGRVTLKVLSKFDPRYADE